MSKKEFNKTRYQKIKEKYPDIIVIKCKRCGENTEVKQFYLILEKNFTKNCKKCCSEISSETFKKTRARETPEERSEKSRKSSKLANKKNSVENQWKTIKSWPKEKYDEFLRQKSIKMKKAWSNYTNEKKKKILDALVASNNCGRSKFSEKVKLALINNKLYEGFSSEEYFCGFYPDEINHELKLIIECQGDVYHCNPRRYKDSTEFVPFINRTVQEQWDRDKRRLIEFYKKGYSVIIIWEYDWICNFKKELKRISYEINKKRNIE